MKTLKAIELYCYRHPPLRGVVRKLDKATGIIYPLLVAERFARIELKRMMK